MDRETFHLIENYMLQCMDPRDVAHGAEHVRRVLYAALDIAAHEQDVNLDVLICACLLHDIQRSGCFRDRDCNQIRLYRTYDFALPPAGADRSLHHVSESLSAACHVLGRHSEPDR